MNTVKYFIAVGLAFLSIGCPARSLFPLFTENDLVTVPEIFGTWGDGKGETYTFLKAADKSYDVVWRNQEGNTGLYKVQLGKLGKSRFLDSSPETKDPDYHMIATHVISKFSLDGDSLRIASLQSDWLKKMIGAGTLQIPHVIEDDEVILTASTRELQQLVLRAAEDTDAFPNPGALVRLK